MDDRPKQQIAECYDWFETMASRCLACPIGCELQDIIPKVVVRHRIHSMAEREWEKLITLFEGRDA